MGAYNGPIGSEIGFGQTGLMPGTFGRTLGDAAKSIFANEQIAQGIGEVVGSLKGGIPVDPGYLPNPAGGPAYGAIPRDWDANAWQAADDLLEPGGMPIQGPEVGGSLLKQGLSKIGMGMLTAARNSAIFAGLISLAVNGYKVIAGKERISEAAGSVVADTADGAFSGALGAAASGAAIFGAGALGLTVGLPLTLVGIAAGIGGALLGSLIFKKIGIYGAIKNGVTKLFGGSAIGHSIGREMPIHGPGFGRTLGYETPIGGMIPVNPNLGRLVPLH